MEEKQQEVMETLSLKLRNPGWFNMAVDIRCGVKDNLDMIHPGVMMMRMMMLSLLYCCSFYCCYVNAVDSFI
jgi:hypothetical protein